MFSWAQVSTLETPVQKPAVTTIFETVMTIMEWMKAAHTVSQANEDTTDTILESDSNITDHKPQPPSKSVFKAPPDTKRWIERALADPGVVTKINIEVIVKNCRTKWTTTLQSQRFKAVTSRFEGAFQASYFISNNGSKLAMVQVVEHVQRNLVRIGHAPTASEAQLHYLNHIKALADPIIQSVLFNTARIVRIAETVGKIVDKAVNKFFLCHMKEASMKVAGTKLFI